MISQVEGLGLIARLYNGSSALFQAFKDLVPTDTSRILLQKGTSNGFQKKEKDEVLATNSISFSPTRKASHSMNINCKWYSLLYIIESQKLSAVDIS